MDPLTRISVGSLLAIALLGVPTQRVQAQSAQNGGEEVPIPNPRPATWDIIPATALAEIERGDVLLAARKFKKSREAYNLAAELIIAEGGFPSLPLRNIAKSYYYEGRYQKAVSVLDDLADESAAVGDIGTQAWALADAAWVLGMDYRVHAPEERPGAKLEMHDRAHRIRMVLASPYLPDDIRAAITRQRCGGCHEKTGVPVWAKR